MSDEYDTTEHVEHTDTGCSIRVECKRGTGTNDRDTVRAEAKVESLDEVSGVREEMVDEVESALLELRSFDPDAVLEDDNE